MAKIVDNSGYQVKKEQKMFTVLTHQLEFDDDGIPYWRKLDKPIKAKDSPYYVIEWLGGNTMSEKGNVFRGRMEGTTCTWAFWLGNKGEDI